MQGPLVGLLEGSFRSPGRHWLVMQYVKVLWIFIGFGDIDAANWNPRIDAVSKCLTSWKMRSLSYSGRAIVANALALSRIWYVAFLVHMPRWVLSKLNSLVFKFFWAGKKKLSPTWCCFSKERFWRLLCCICQIQSSSPFGAVGEALSGVPGWLDLITDLLAFRSFWYWPSDHSWVRFPFLLSAFVSFLSDCLRRLEAYWPATWSQIFYMPLDRTVIDLSWEIAYGALYTAERLSSFGYAISTVCFCNVPMESAEHLFFPCLFAKSGIDWIQSQLFLAVPPASSISLRQMTKVLVLVLMKLSLFSGFSLIFSLCWNTGFGPSEMIFTLVLLLQALLVFWRAWRFVFVFT